MWTNRAASQSKNWLTEAQASDFIVDAILYFYPDLVFSDVRLGPRTPRGG
jgi:hypothetical protein